jgi:hypothetical protein
VKIDIPAWTTGTSMPTRSHSGVCSTATSDHPMSRTVLREPIG